MAFAKHHATLNISFSAWNPIHTNAIDTRISNIVVPPPEANYSSSYNVKQPASLPSMANANSVPLFTAAK